MDFYLNRRLVRLRRLRLSFGLTFFRKKWFYGSTLTGDQLFILLKAVGNCNPLHKELILKYTINSRNSSPWVGKTSNWFSAVSTSILISLYVQADITATFIVLFFETHSLFIKRLLTIFSKCHQLHLRSFGLREAKRSVESGWELRKGLVLVKEGISPCLRSSSDIHSSIVFVTWKCMGVLYSSPVSQMDRRPYFWFSYWAFIKN